MPLRQKTPLHDISLKEKPAPLTPRFPRPAHSAGLDCQSSDNLSCCC